MWRFVAPGHEWARSLPLRYAIAFLFAYACFFLAVRVWAETATEEPEQQGGTAALDTFLQASGNEGCVISILLLAAGFVAGGLFMAAGGAPALLEAAFEAAFAGVVVTRPLRGDFVLDWKRRVLQNTWKPALLALLALVALASILQARAPHAATFAEVVRALVFGGSRP